MAASGFDLARLWSEAPALLPHGAGCGCAGHVAMHLDPAAVEADILEYLCARYEAAGEAELTAFMAQRRAAHGLTFASWLMGLDHTALPAAARERLLADLEATIGSLARTSRQSG